MKTLSLEKSGVLAQVALAIAVAGALPTALYALFLGAVGNGALLLLLTLQGVVFAVLLTPVLGLLYVLARRRLLHILMTASTAVGLILFCNSINLCPAEVTATLNSVQICIEGTATLAGWWSIACTTIEGLLLGLVGGAVFWQLAPKKDAP